MLQHNTDDNRNIHTSNDQAPVDSFLTASLMMKLPLELLSVRLTEELLEIVKANIKLG